MKITRAQLRRLISESSDRHSTDYSDKRAGGMVRYLLQVLNALRGVTPEDIAAGSNSGSLSRILSELQFLVNDGLIKDLNFYPVGYLIQDAAIISFKYEHPKRYLENSLNRYFERTDDVQRVSRMDTTYKLFLSETTITYRVQSYNLTIYLSPGENQRI